MRPEWAKLATKMKGIAKVAKIDASIHRKFDQVFGLKGYPHVVMIPAGNSFAIQAQKTRRFTMLTKEPVQLIVFTIGRLKRSNRTKVSSLRDSLTKTSGTKTASVSKFHSVLSPSYLTFLIPPMRNVKSILKS